MLTTLTLILGYCHNCPLDRVTFEEGEHLISFRRKLQALNVVELLCISRYVVILNFGLAQKQSKSKVRIRYGNNLLVLSVHIKGQPFRVYRQLPVEVQIMINFYDRHSYPAPRQVVCRVDD